MSSSRVVNGVRIAYEDVGKGDPLVLVHGSWGSHHNWDAVVPALAERHRVVSYDRRGHSESERLARPGHRSLAGDRDESLSVAYRSRTRRRAASTFRSSSIAR